jgi:DNA-binding NarL/FixJ family response regulator
VSVRLVLVDDQAMVRAGFRLILESESDLEVVGEAENGARAVDVVRVLRPDVTLMDVHFGFDRGGGRRGGETLPGLDGIEATRRIREQDPDATVLILTGGTTAGDIDRSRKAGAAVYLTKDRIATELVAEIRRLGGR